MVVVITGPIASGKSTVARELMCELERCGALTGVIDLDLVCESIAGDEPKSDAAKGERKESAKPGKATRRPAARRARPAGKSRRR